MALGKSKSKEETPAPAPKPEVRPLPEMATRLVDLEKRVEALEAKTNRPR